MLIFNPSYVCHNMNIFWPASFTKLPWHYWTEFNQSWKELRKILQSHENLWSLTDISGANIGIHSNSRDWLFLMFMMPKINPLMNKSLLFWKDVKRVFSIFIKIAEMQFQSTDISLLHMYQVHVSSTSTFTRIVQCCADLIKCNVEHQKWSR